MTAIIISRDLTLETDGTVSGLDCGLRASGVIVARQGDAPKAHFNPPVRMAFAPALYDMVAGIGELNAVRTTSDGRIVADPRLANVATILAKVEACCGDERGRGGIPDGTHGVYDIEQSRDGWRYLVTTTPSGRASLKKIATWTGESGKFTVPYAEGGALAAILERAVTAKVKGETTTIRLPEVPGVTVRIEGGEILVCPDRRDNEVIRAVPSIRWDPSRGAYAVSTRYSKRLGVALEEVKARVEERAVKEAEAKAAAIVEAARKREADAVERKAAEERRAAEWERTRPEREAAAAAARVAKAEADRIEAAERAAKGIGSYLESAHRTPAVGAVIMFAGRARVVTGLGRVFRADEDTSSMGGPIGAEGERLREVHYRAATDEEASPLMAETAARVAKAEAAKAVAAMRRRVQDEGEAVDLGREPEGEVLVDESRSAAHGYRTWMVLDAEGGLWAMTYDGSDGAAWGMYNCGYNTVGKRLDLAPAEIEAFNAAIRRSNE